MAVSVKDVDKAKSSTRHIVMLCRVLLCIGDEQATVDVLDAERRVSCWNRWIIEAAVGGHRHIHSSAASSGGAKPPVQAEMVPSSVSKMNEATLGGSWFGTRNPVVVLVVGFHTRPVGAA